MLWNTDIGDLEHSCNLVLPKHVKVVSERGLCQIWCDHLLKRIRHTWSLIFFVKSADFLEFLQTKFDFGPKTSFFKTLVTTCPKMFPKIPNYLVTSVSSLFLVSRLIGHGWSRLLLTQDFSRLLITSHDFSSLLRLITLSVIVHHQQHHRVSRKLMLFLMTVGSTASTWIDRNSWPHSELRNWSSLFEVKHNAWTESLPYEWFTNLTDYFWSRKRWWLL